MVKKSILLLFFFSLGLCSCSKDADQEVSEAILSAQLAIDSSDCDSAINILSAVGAQPKNGRYLKTLATAYACKAGYKTVDFFSSDIEKIGNGWKGLANMNLSSQMESPTSAGYINLWKAIDVLLFAGGLDTTENPTSTKRIAQISQKDINDLHPLLLYLLLTQMGKYLYFYGQASDSDGTKGACYLGYQDGGATELEYDPDGDGPLTVQTIDIASILALGQTGANCTSVGNGHPQLPDNGADAFSTTEKTRLCEGIVLINNIRDVLPVVIGSIAGDDFDDIATWTDEIDSILATSDIDSMPGLTELVTAKGRSYCLNLGSTDANFERFFLLFYELLHQ